MLTCVHKARLVYQCTRDCLLLITPELQLSVGAAALYVPTVRGIDAVVPLHVGVPETAISSFTAKKKSAVIINNCSGQERTQECGRRDQIVSLCPVQKHPK